LVVITVGVANVLMRPVYKATTTVEIAPDSNVVKLENIEDTQQTSYREIAETQGNIIRSESVAVAVLDKLNLWDDPELSGEISQRGIMNGVGAVKSMLLGEEGLLRSWMSSEADDAAELADLSPEEVARRGVLNRFSERLTVEPVRNSYLFRVS